MKFTTNNKTSINFNIAYENKTTEEVLTTIFFGLQIDNTVLPGYNVVVYTSGLSCSAFLLKRF
jgi:hypothetical protein